MEQATKHFKKRDAILSCLRGTTVHPDAEWVYAQLKPIIPDLSLATVYRNLNYFKERGDIISLGTVAGVERFDGNVTPHVHFICTVCGKIADLEQIEVPQELSDTVSAQTGYLVCGCSLTFTGKCQLCNNNSE